MSILYRILLAAHIAMGFVGLAAFWFPVFAKKGGRVHVRAGTVFLWCGWAVAGSAVVLGLLDIAVPLVVHPEERPADPALVPYVAAELRGIGAFLGYLGLLTLAAVHHGVRSIQNPRRPERLRTPFHTALNGLAVAASAAILLLGLFRGEFVYVLLSPIGAAVALPNLRYARRPPAERMSHWYEHMGSMLAAGIAFHTAFAVFGGARLFGLGLDGAWAFVPWVTPAVVGTLGISIWTARYRRRFEGRGVGAAAPTG